MNFVERLIDGVQSFMNVNSATLSGAVDIIVVPQDDGTLASTSFHVRYGKLKVLSSHQKKVKIYVNEMRVPGFGMVLGRAGEAYFVHKTYEPPLPEDITVVNEVDEDSESEERVANDVNSSKSNDMSEDWNWRWELASQRNIPLPSNDNGLLFNNDEGNRIHPEPILEDVSKECINFDCSNKNSNFYLDDATRKKNDPSNLTPWSFFGLFGGKKTNFAERQTTTPKLSTSLPTELPSGLLKNFDYINPENGKKNIHKKFLDEQYFDNNYYDLFTMDDDYFVKYNPFMATEMSLCGPTLIFQCGDDKKEMNRVFNKHKVSETNFLINPNKILNDSNLIFKINNNFYPWNIASLMILSPLVFHRPLPQSIRDEMMKKWKSKYQKPKLWGRIFGWNPRREKEGIDNSILDDIGQYSNAIGAANLLTESIKQELVQERRKMQNDNELTLMNDKMTCKSLLNVEEFDKFTETTVNNLNSNDNSNCNQNNLNSNDNFGCNKNTNENCTFNQNTNDDYTFNQNILNSNNNYTVNQNTNDDYTVNQNILNSNDNYTVNKNILNSNDNYTVNQNTLNSNDNYTFNQNTSKSNDNFDCNQNISKSNDNFDCNQNTSKSSNSTVIQKIFDHNSNSRGGAAVGVDDSHIDSSVEDEPLNGNTNEKGPIYYYRSLKPTSSQLVSCNLKPGANRIVFVVNCGGGNYQEVEGCIFLWKKTSKIVVSDIDGTITRSDVLGQILPVFGRDWSHNGVAALFTNIKANGYEILYLTSRSIGASKITKEFLASLKQNTMRLPNGPVFMSPDRLLHSINREVILRRPELFKIQCLTEIKELFGPNKETCFYAGFGNRNTDAASYHAVNIPPGKIFIINPLGEITGASKVIQQSYTRINELVEQIFPPYNDEEEEKNQKKNQNEEIWNDFNYWMSRPIYSLEDLEKELEG